MRFRRHVDGVDKNLIVLLGWFRVVLALRWLFVTARCGRTRMMEVGYCTCWGEDLEVLYQQPVWIRHR